MQMVKLRYASAVVVYVRYSMGQYDDAGAVGDGAPNLKS